MFKHFHLFLHIWDQYSWTKTKNFSTPIKAFSSEPSVETVAAFAVLGFQLGAPPIILHPRPPTETSQKLDFFKNKTVFLPPLSPIFPNILSSCKWVVHSREGYWKYTSGYLAILVIMFSFNDEEKLVSYNLQFKFEF